MIEWEEIRSNIRQMFQWAVQALAQPADVQRALFPPFVPPAEELALDFDNWWRTYQDHFGHSLRDEQLKAVRALDDLLAEMSGPDKCELWTDAGCLNHPKWAEVRRLASDILYAFAWPNEVPPIGRSIYAQYKEDGTGEIWPP